MCDFTRMALAYDGPLPGYEPRYHPTYYLSDEASQRRIAALVEKIAADPNSPDYAQVPPRIQRLVDARRAELERNAA